MAASLRNVRFSKSIFSTDCCRHIVCRRKSASTKTYRKEGYRTEPPQLQTIENDWIGPADKVSNIRKYQYYIPENESEDELKFRLKREETQEWHHQFWTNHNKNFFMLKDEFVKRKLKERHSVDGDTTDKTITPEEMSEFYKKFLDENYTLHKNYNKEWYKRNISLLWPALKLKLKRKLSKNSSAG